MLPLSSRYESWAELWCNGAVVIPKTVAGTSYLDLKPELFAPDAGAFGTPWLPRGRKAQLRVAPHASREQLTVIQSGNGRNESVSLSDEFAFLLPDLAGVYVYLVCVHGTEPDRPDFVFKVQVL